MFLFLLLLTFTVRLPHPVGAVHGQDAPQLTSYQSVFGWTLQGNNGAHVGAVALGDLLGAQGRQWHGRTLSPGLT